MLEIRGIRHNYGQHMAGVPSAGGYKHTLWLFPGAMLPHTHMHVAMSTVRTHQSGLRCWCRPTYMRVPVQRAG